jgi:hypothetical protein
MYGDISYMEKMSRDETYEDEMYKDETYGKVMYGDVSSLYPETLLLNRKILTPATSIVNR